MIEYTLSLKNRLFLEAVLGLQKKQIENTEFPYTSASFIILLGVSRSVAAHISVYICYN
jgi:hypothetical protein